jgi:hypothetical protein
MTDRPKLLVARSRADRFVQVGAVGAVVALMAWRRACGPDVPATVQSTLAFRRTRCVR